MRIVKRLGENTELSTIDRDSTARYYSHEPQCGGDHQRGAVELYQCPQYHLPLPGSGPRHSLYPHGWLAHASHDE